MRTTDGLALLVNGRYQRDEHKYRAVERCPLGQAGYRTPPIPEPFQRHDETETRRFPVLGVPALARS
jgi:hypothetical protein